MLGQMMQTLSPISLDLRMPLGSISPRSLEEHYKLYRGYVERYNELRARLEGIHRQGTVLAVEETESLKVDITFALGAVKNHEIFFGMLGEEGEAPAGKLAEAIGKSFGSLPNYMIDLKQTAMSARGWAWTAYDLNYGHLFNYPGTAQNAMPVPNVVPILAIDLYGHAYFYDFGGNKTAYIEALLHDIAWMKVAKRYEGAVKLGAVTGN
jgi:superoxide dismutase, Fe-Mn family